MESPRGLPPPHLGGQRWCGHRVQPWLRSLCSDTINMDYISGGSNTDEGTEQPSHRLVCSLLSVICLSVCIHFSYWEGAAQAPGCPRPTWQAPMGLEWAVWMAHLPALCPLSGWERQPWSLGLSPPIPAYGGAFQDNEGQKHSVGGWRGSG